MTPKELGKEKAFPLISPDGMAVNQGLSIREYFAAKAMQGLMVQAIAGWHNSNNESNNKHIAEHSVAIADALLAELSKTQS